MFRASGLKGLDNPTGAISVRGIALFNARQPSELVVLVCGKLQDAWLWHAKPDAFGLCSFVDSTMDALRMP